MNALHLHPPAPDLGEVRRPGPDAPGERCTVGAREDALGLKLKACVQVLRVVVCCRGVAELYDHLSEKDPARIHDMLGIVIMYSAGKHRYAVLALQRCRYGVAEELGLWPELADDGELVRGRDVEEGGYRWVVRYCRREDW
jgi:hypothetical protein